MAFYGRESELRELNRFLSKKEQQVGLIFGRRRVGKSELIKQGLREANAHGIAQVEKAGLPCYRYGFISRNGFSAIPIDKTIFISLSRLYQ